MRLGVLDVGSNTVHLLVVDAHQGGHPLPAFSHKAEPAPRRAPHRRRRDRPGRRPRPAGLRGRGGGRRRGPGLRAACWPSPPARSARRRTATRCWPRCGRRPASTCRC
nr:hypothetical protein [Angustibacter aerolatus]